MNEGKLSSSSMHEEKLAALDSSTSVLPEPAPLKSHPYPQSISSSLTAIDYTRHTLPRRPWRLRSTSFSEIAKASYDGEGTLESPYCVEWLADDVENPQNFTNFYKWTVTFTVATCTMAIAMASSVYSAAATSIIETFHVSTEIFALGISVFVLGFAFGPLIWAPCSEVYGRRNTFLVSYVAFTAWNGGAAGANSIEALLVFRLLASVFGSSPFANSGGTIADMFDARQRGLAMAVFAAMPFTGPALGPIVGGFISDAGGFRAVEWFLFAFTAVLTVLGFLFIPETFASRLLRDRAATLSKVTGNVYRAPQDLKQELSIIRLLKVSLARPWKFLFLEPLVIIVSSYMSIVYGTLYLMFGAFPIVFEQDRGWSSGTGGLAFLGILVGMLLAVVYVIFYVNPQYLKVMDANNGVAPPEARLPPSIIGSALLVVGLAWFSASCGPKTHYMIIIVGTLPFGSGMVLVFLSLMNYLVEVFTIYAASVLAANAVMRSCFGAAFPLFTKQMYAKLGPNWASSIPAFLSLACVPFPIIFYKYGVYVREKSRYAREAAEELAKLNQGTKKNKEVEEV